MKVGFFGLKGSYTNQAAINIFANYGKSIEFVEHVFFEDIFKFIKKDNLAIIPVENSNGGIVSQVLDMFPKYNFLILGEYFLPINHVLLANKDVKINQIKEVYSHTQSIFQTSDFLEKNKIKPIVFFDNSSAAKFISENNFLDKACIGSEVLADIYNLKILKRNFQNSTTNTTRFLVIGNNDNLLKIKLKNLKYKTSILFTTKDMHSVLYKCLGGFATNGISLTKIESRPIKNKFFDYFFFLEFVGNLNEEKVILSMKELNFYTKKIKIFGSYQKIQ